MYVYNALYVYMYMVLSTGPTSTNYIYIITYTFPIYMCCLVKRPIIILIIIRIYTPISIIMCIITVIRTIYYY